MDTTTTTPATKSRNYIFGYTEQNPLIVENYPYGFKLRCTIKYWIESVPKKGDRFCSQTNNPKFPNGRWNKPKKSTFSCIGVMFLDENQHVKWAGVSHFDYGDKTRAFVESVGGVEMLNPEQKKQYNLLMGINEVKRDEFTDKVKKDFSVKWERDTIGAGWKDGVYNKGEQGKYREVKITFDRPDGVKLIEIYNAMKSLNQDKLNEVFEVRECKSIGSVIFTSDSTYTGTVRICIRGGYQLTTVGEESYKNFLASDTNILADENI